jgi:hypothetical protein
LNVLSVSVDGAFHPVEFHVASRDLKQRRDGASHRVGAGVIAIANHNDAEGDRK